MVLRPPVPNNTDLGYKKVDDAIMTTGLNNWDNSLRLDLLRAVVIFSDGSGFG